MVGQNNPDRTKAFVLKFSFFLFKKKEFGKKSMFGKFRFSDNLNS